MADVNVNLPELAFDEVSRANLRKRQVVAATEHGTIYQGEVDKAFVAVTGAKSKNPGSLQFVFDIKPLDARGKPAEASVRHYVAIPRANPLILGHMLSNKQVFDAYTKMRETIRALEGQDALPRMPRKADGTDYYVDANGKQLTPDEVKAAFNAGDAAVDAFLKKWYAADEAGKRGVEDLKGALLFFTVRQSDNGYANMGFIRHDAGDMTVVPAAVTAAS